MMVLERKKDKIATNSSGGEGSHTRNEGSISLSQHHGKPMAVNIVGATRNSQVPSISANSLRQIPTDMDLCSRKVLRIAAFIRAEINTPGIIEPRYQKKISESNHRFDEYFEPRVFAFVTTKGEKSVDSPEIVVICKNLRSFIQDVMDRRQVSNVQLKFGIDGGVF